MVFVALSFINVFINGASPTDEFNAYITNFKYGISITKYTNSIKTSVDNIKTLIDSKDYSTETLSKIQKEQANLITYKNAVYSLDHSPKLNTFHEKYCNYVNTIVSTSDTTTKFVTTNGSEIKQVNEFINTLKTSVDSLVELSKSPKSNIISQQ
jgi:hypothetical protein